MDTARRCGRRGGHLCRRGRLFLVTLLHRQRQHALHQIVELLEQLPSRWARGLLRRTWRGLVGHDFFLRTFSFQKPAYSTKNV